VICSWVQHRLVAYLDAELPTPGRLKVESHLSACGSCREALKLFESTRPGPGTPQTHPPEFWAPMHEAVLKELLTDPKPTRPFRQHWVIAYALLSLIALGWSLLQLQAPGGAP
jgi:anti-sigma factor RsiW